MSKHCSYCGETHGALSLCVFPRSLSRLGWWCVTLAARTHRKLKTRRKRQLYRARRYHPFPPKEE